nr:MAG TPA: hypothetical protein [Caudoviricetes sp.]
MRAGDFRRRTPQPGSAKPQQPRRPGSGSPRRRSGSASSSAPRSPSPGISSHCGKPACCPPPIWSPRPRKCYSSSLRRCGT